MLARHAIIGLLAGSALSGADAACEQEPQPDTLAVDAWIQGEGPAGSVVTALSAGDLNGDGVADVVLGAPYADGAHLHGGVVWVFEGPLPSSTDFSNAEFQIEGPRDYAKLGWSVEARGDFNGDGLNDLVVAATDADLAGEIFVWSGRADLSSLPATPDAHIVAAGSNFAALGYSMAYAGDLNRDGYDDLLVGAPMSVVGGLAAAGAALVFYGPLEGEIEAASADLILEGEAASDTFGFAVAAGAQAGGDSAPDLLIGAPGSGDGNEGAAFLFTALPTHGRVTCAGASLRLQGEDGDVTCGLLGCQGIGDEAGTAVALTGDVDGDGTGDLLVGAPRRDELGQDEIGVVYLVRGGATGSRSLATAEARIVGAADEDEWGRALTGPVDLDGDGLTELVGAAPGFDGDDTNSGVVAVFRGPVAGELDLFDADAWMVAAGGGSTLLGVGLAWTPPCTSQGGVGLLASAQSSDNKAVVILARF